MCAPRTRQRPSPVVYVLCLSLLSLLVTCGEENRTLISEVALEELVSDNLARTKNNSDGGGGADDRDALRSEIVIDAGGDGADARTDPCVIYGSLETPQQNAWLFTIDLKGNVTQLLGPMLLKAHVPGLAVHPVTGELYALVVNQTGAKATSLAKVDPVSGALEWIGQTGLDRVEGLSFRPTDATLWAWSRKHGLVRIDPATAAVEVVQDFRIEASALAWDPAGAVLYLAGNRNLWAYEDDPAGALRRVAQPLPVSIGGLAMRGDGQLLATAAHTSANTGGLDLLVYDPAPGAVAVTLHAPAVPVDTGRRADEAAARVEALTWPVACGNPSPGGDAEMILSIEIDRSEVCPGETIHVEVEAVHPEGGGNPVLVSIDGLPGSERTLQLTGAPGPRLINVSAWTPEGYADRGSETVQVIDCSPAESPARLFVGMNPFHPYTADFLVANADEIAPEGTVYEWEFGDGEWAQTDVPFVSHSYEASLEPDREYTSFEASVAVQRPGGTELWTPETVTVWNAYAANRKRGLIQPLTTSQPELIRSGSLLTGEYSLRNLEEGPITLTRRQIEQHPCDPDADPVALPWEAISLTLGPGEEVTETLELEADAVPEGVCGIALHLVGQAGLSRRVGTDVYFQVTANPLFEEPVTDAPTVTFLNDIAAQGLVPDPDYITDEDLYRLRQERRVVVPPSTMSLAASPRKHARAAMGNGGGGCACGCTHDTLPAGGPCEDLIGCECERDETLPADHPCYQRLSCQATQEWVRHPPYLQNALKGDVILVGGCGFVGQMLRQLDPPQVYVHTGIMTKNHTQIAHSTSTDKRYANEDYLEGTIPPHIHINDNILRYGWPGIIREDVAAAFSRVLMYDDHGDGYWLTDFTAEPDGCVGSVVPPLVVKPPADLAQSARPTLHAAADIAANVATPVYPGFVGWGTGHYRFYAYTDAAIAFDPMYDAPPGQPATVCSTFAWYALKRAHAVLEGATLEPTDVARGARWDDFTRDGLYLYSEASRRNAAQFMWNYVHNEGMASSWFDALFDWGADGPANQMVNVFAADDADNGLSHPAPSPGTHQVTRRREHPGVGRSVSPDNVLFWDPPPTGVYGYSERLSYRSGAMVRVYRWKPSEGTGTVTGTVKHHHQPVQDATVILHAAGGLETQSGPGGRFEFIAIPAGDYEIDAQFPTPEYLLSSGPQPVSVAAGASTDVVLDLRPPVTYRKVKIEGNAYITDLEWWLWCPGTHQSSRNVPIIGLACNVDPVGASDDFYWQTVCCNEPHGNDAHLIIWDRCDYAFDNIVLVNIWMGLAGGTGAAHYTRVIHPDDAVQLPATSVYKEETDDPWGIDCGTRYDQAQVNLTLTNTIQY